MTLLRKLSFIFFVGLFISGCGPQQKGEIRTLTGHLEKTHPNWDSLKGQWLVINYWAIWCKPCREEIPEFNKIAQLEHVTMLGVNYDNSQGEELKKQAEELDVQFSTLLDDPSSRLAYPRPNVLPTTIIINPKGELHTSLLGPQTEKSILQALK